MEQYIDYTQTNESKFFKSLNQLWDLYHLIYGHKSNKYFDELHDSVYIQVNTFSRIPDYRNILKSDLIEIEQLLNEVKAYYKASQKLIEPNWIYG